MEAVLKQIKRIFRCPIGQLSLVVTSSTSCIVPVENFTEIPIYGLASLSVSSKVTNKANIYDTKLVAHICGDYELDNTIYAYMAETIRGERFVIGTDVRPFPTVTTSDSFPDNMASKSGKTLTISLTSYLSPLYVIN